jgi:hypothetical protein
MEFLRHCQTDYPSLLPADSLQISSFLLQVPLLASRNRVKINKDPRGVQALHRLVAQIKETPLHQDLAWVDRLAWGTIDVRKVR